MDPLSHIQPLKNGSFALHGFQGFVGTAVLLWDSITCYGYAIISPCLFSACM